MFTPRKHFLTCRVAKQMNELSEEMLASPLCETACLKKKIKQMSVRINTHRDHWDTANGVLGPHCSLGTPPRLSGFCKLSSQIGCWQVPVVVWYSWNATTGSCWSIHDIIRNTVNTINTFYGHARRRLWKHKKVKSAQQKKVKSARRRCFAPGRHLYVNIWQAGNAFEAL